MSKSPLDYEQIYSLLREGCGLQNEFASLGARVREQHVSVVELRTRLGDILGNAHFNNVVIPVHKHGKPYAAIASSDIGEFLEKWRNLLNRFNEATSLRPEPLFGEAKLYVHEVFSAAVDVIRTMANVPRLET